METDDLKKIVEKVLGDLRQAESRQKLLVFSGSGKYLIDKFFLDAQQICRKSKIKIAVDQSARKFLNVSTIKTLPNVGNVYGYEDSADPEDVLEGVDTVVFGSMDTGTAAKIAGFQTDTLSSEIAQQALLKGIRFLSGNFTQGIGEKGNYGKAILKMTGVLESYGVEFVPAEELKKRLEGDDFAEDTDVAEKIITEKLIQNYQGGRLRVRRDAVITPLARDAVRERKIVILRGE